MPGKLVHVHAVKAIRCGLTNADGPLHRKMFGPDAIHLVLRERKRGIVVFGELRHSSEVPVDAAGEGDVGNGVTNAFLGGGDNYSADAANTSIGRT